MGKEMEPQDTTRENRYPAYLIYPLCSVSHPLRQPCDPRKYGSRPAWIMLCVTSNVSLFHVAVALRCSPLPPVSLRRGPAVP